MDREKLFELFNDEDMEGIKQLVAEINGWNGSLDWLEYFENDEYFINEFFKTPAEAVRAAYYGDYNYCDDYVHFNAYGNLDSCSEWELLDELKSNLDEIFDAMIDNYSNIDITCLSDEFVEALDAFMKE